MNTATFHKIIAKSDTDVDKNYIRVDEDSFKGLQGRTALRSEELRAFWRLRRLYVARALMAYWVAPGNYRQAFDQVNGWPASCHAATGQLL